MTSELLLLLLLLVLSLLAAPGVSSEVGHEQQVQFTGTGHIDADMRVRHR